MFLRRFLTERRFLLKGFDCYFNEYLRNGERFWLRLRENRQTAFDLDEVNEKLTCSDYI